MSRIAFRTLRAHEAENAPVKVTETCLGVFVVFVHERFQVLGRRARGFAVLAVAAFAAVQRPTCRAGHGPASRVFWGDDSHHGAAAGAEHFPTRRERHPAGPLVLFLRSIQQVQRACTGTYTTGFKK